jgi:hypothetical protein
MESQRYKDLSQFDRRLQAIPGIVYTFSTEAEWRNFMETCSPKALTNRASLTVILAKED